MNTPLQQLYDQLLTGKLPSMWKAVSYPSLKPVEGYVTDLMKRISFFTTWYNNGLPDDFWLPGFFFTQSFLTGALQNYARKYRLPIDTLEFDFFISQRVGSPTRTSETEGSITSSPEDGVIVWGLFLDGAGFDQSKNILVDPKPKELFAQAPCIWITPVESSTLLQKKMGEGSNILTYDCPMYKTSERRGVLSTTGQSTNFVMSVRLPCETNPSFWILRGTALLTQLDE